MTAYRREADDSWVALGGTTGTELPGVAQQVPLRVETLFLERAD